jgi:hypothetical protein
MTSTKSLALKTELIGYEGGDSKANGEISDDCGGACDA